MTIGKSKEWYNRAHIITWVLAWFFCIVPTAITGYLELPQIVSVKDSATTLTGSAIVVIACCAYPILKGVLKMLKSPSAWLILWCIALITFALYNIPHNTLGAMVVIFFVAAIGNSIGAILFLVSKKFKEKEIILIHD
jgi:hypothetical protein